MKCEKKKYSRRAQVPSLKVECKCRFAPVSDILEKDYALAYLKKYVSL